MTLDPVEVLQAVAWGVTILAAAFVACTCFTYFLRCSLCCGKQSAYAMVWFYVSAI